MSMAYAVLDVRNGKFLDATVWTTNLNCYAVKVGEANGDIVVNPNEKRE